MISTGVPGSLLALALALSGCGSPPPRPIPTVSSPSPICGSPVEARVQPLAQFMQCGRSDALTATYVRVGVRGVDLVGFHVVDISPTFRDGPEFHAEGLLADDRVVEAEVPSPEIDALAPADPIDDEIARAFLYAVALHASPSAVATDAGREALANDWHTISDTVRARPVGLSRDGGRATLAVLIPSVGEGMDGWAGRLTHASYTLVGGHVTVQTEILLSASGHGGQPRPWVPEDRYHHSRYDIDDPSGSGL